MLVLSRKVGEKFRIGDDVVVTVTDVKGKTVRLGVEAPRAMVVMREELLGDPAASPPSAPSGTAAAPDAPTSP